MQSCWRGHRARLDFGLSARVLATCLRRHRALVEQRQADREDRAARLIQSLWRSVKAVRARRAAVEAICRFQAMVGQFEISHNRGSFSSTKSCDSQFIAPRLLPSLQRVSHCI